MLQKILLSLVVTIIFALASLLAIPAHAQDNTDDGQIEDETLELERMAVTGYHLKRIDFEGPAPGFE